ncbi:hypothetical protein QAD02_021159 [Eretmocerus hayati]|uniref:Uncharacterized protein n=1 Tax=Eretmocerus hayati TaxID=131215 RepID=A0ACC2PQV4_9HYME|nr:hypothetical protein QAD02_021159 [Eretmocerus hayati]
MSRKDYFWAISRKQRRRRADFEISGLLSEKWPVVMPRRDGLGEDANRRSRTRKRNCRDTTAGVPSNDGEDCLGQNHDHSEQYMDELTSLEEDPSWEKYRVDVEYILQDYDYTYDEDDEDDEDFGYSARLLARDFGHNDDSQNDGLEQLMGNMRLGNHDTMYRGEDVSKIIDSVARRIVYFLPTWSIQNGVSQNCLQALLHELREIPGLATIPASPRTILQTPRHSKPVTLIGGGEYCHIGVEECFNEIIRRRIATGDMSTRIRLILSTDGAPLGSSSGKTLWPILASCSLSENVYIIGVFLGSSKPHDANEFFGPTVEDLQNVINDGFEHDGRQYSVELYALICDAPGKAYVLGLKSHSGFYSCPKCEVRGTYYTSVCLPKRIGRLRTDVKFREGHYYENPGGDLSCEAHQLRDSILTRINGFGPVTNVVIEPMHQLYLGPTRKLLLIWQTNASGVKDEQRALISDRLIQLRDYITYDFARRPRAFHFVKIYKATELRLFLLYTGPVALKGILPDNKYQHFLLLHIAATILSRADFCEREDMITFAEDLLRVFVEQYAAIYGEKLMAYNVHQLLHLANECRTYGKLDNFSAFRFENFIRIMKSLVRSGNQPLQQLMRRRAEIESANANCAINREMDWSHQRSKGRQFKGFNERSRTKVYRRDGLIINCVDGKNGYVLIDNSETGRECRQIVVECDYIQKSVDGELFIVGNELEMVGDFYTTPFPSSALGVHVVSKRTVRYDTWNVKRLVAKILRLPFQDEFVTFLILHTLPGSDDRV